MKKPNENLSDPATAVAPVTQAELLSVDDAKQAIELQKKYPDVALAAASFVTSADGFARRTVALCIALRARPELTDIPGAVNCLLVSCGLTKQRASFIRRLVEVPDIEFKRIESGEVTVKAAVAAQRAAKPGRGGRKKKATVAPPMVSYKALPKEFADVAATLCDACVSVCKSGHGYRYERKTSDGVKVSLFIAVA